ncbi:ligand-binding sensor domain-containing diguanylate cyclase [Acanthopleuribacter pedis]|uniref:Diguanylate cyclase n=1 Tax=Acanthopleuribacter pedis TaxID=442870 RepID=A0A8J7QGI8_9BACT|nr:ligand-binding sensor domain-containing diguanylate cyclase [Acanthopleuribacter pedis]MBO1318233.1 diguanylate cyclase [Acanthopleuribacter pedis]
MFAGLIRYWCLWLMVVPLLHARTVFHYHYGARNGLTQNTVRLLRQDPSGQVWAGTLAGLSRFDGRHFWNFSHGNGFENHPVRDVAWLGDRRLALTANGEVFEIGLNRATRIPLAARVHALIRGEDRLLLLTTEALVDFGSDTRYPLGEGVNPALTFAFFTHQLGSDLFYSLDEQLFCFDGRRAPFLVNRFDAPIAGLVTTPNQRLGVLSGSQVFEAVPEVGPAHFRVLYEAPAELVPTCADGNGRQLLVGTRDGTYIIVDDGGTRRLRVGLPRKALVTVLIDREGNFWGGYDSGGMVLIPKVKFESFTSKDGIGSSEAFYLVHDTFRGGVWVGSRNGGLAHIGSDRKVTAYGREQGLPADQVREVAQASDGRVLIGTQDGTALIHLDNRVAVVTPDCGIIVRTFYETADGDLLAGGFGGDLLMIPREGAPRCLNGIGLPKRQDVRRIFAFGEHLYVGTNSGLYRSEKEPLAFSAVGELMGVDVVDYLIESEHTLWVAGRTQGLWRYAEGKWYSEKEGLENRLRGLFQDPLGRVWVAGAHAVYLRDGGWRKISTEQGLNSDDIYLVGFDTLGQTWIGTNRGLNLLAHDVVIDSFDYREGLADDELNASGFVIDEDNNAWFCTMGGVSVIQPRDIPRNEVEPLTRIAAYTHGSWSEFDQMRWHPFEGTDEEPVTFAPENNAPRFYLSSSCYSNAGNVRYRTMLTRNGRIVKDWSKPQARHWVSFSHLAPGDYVLSAKSSNNDGLWSAPVSRRFRVDATLMQSPVLRGVAVLLVPTLFGFLFYRQRTRHKRRQKMLEDRLAAQAKELAAATREISELALLDPLTGLQSTRYFETRIDQDVSLVLRRFERSDTTEDFDLFGLGFFLINLDAFGEINRIHGDEVGNLVLREVAQRLRKTVRESDTLVRWSGDQFLLVSHETSPGTAAALALRLHRVLVERPILVADAPLTLCCSLGFALFPFHWEAPDRVTWEQVIALAHGALQLRESREGLAFIGVQGTTPDLTDKQICAMIEDPAHGERENWLRVIDSV